LFEGSPQFTGRIPSYGLVDAQATWTSADAHWSVKLGSSNLLNNRVVQVYGGPVVGRLTYVSLTWDVSTK
jgi:hypothetical protein